jgi:hypothetical protein
MIDEARLEHTIQHLLVSLAALIQHVEILTQLNSNLEVRVQKLEAFLDVKH